MIRPSLELAVAINRPVRYDDEWFDEPDDLDRVERALAAIAAIGEVDDVVTAAAVLAYRAAGRDVQERIIEVFQARRA